MRYLRALVGNKLAARDDSEGEDEGKEGESEERDSSHQILCAFFRWLKIARHDELTGETLVL